MSKLHEMMKDILWDVEKFLRETLQPVMLPSTVATDRNGILEKIALLQREYPQLQVTNRLGSQSLVEPSSPPPYLDMKGTTIKKANTTEYVFSDCTDDHYEVCEKETSSSTVGSTTENYAVNDQDESPYDVADKEITPIPASDLTNAMKNGYLDKKRRGLFSPYQKRWCAVSNGVLYYYSRSTDKRQCGQIKLAGYDIRPVISRDGTRKDLSFELTSPGKRSFQFSASTAKDMQEWISTIEKASVVRCNSVCSSVGPADPCVVSPTISDRIPEEDIYEMIEDHSHLDNTNNGSNLGVSSNSLQDFDDGQDLYDDADSFLPAVLEAQNAFAQLEIENPEEWYVGQWDCNAEETNELSFTRGDLLHVISKEHDSHSWWLCEIKGIAGLVPKNYLMPAYEEVGVRSI